MKNSISIFLFLSASLTVFGCAETADQIIAEAEENLQIENNVTISNETDRFTNVQTILSSSSKRYQDGEQASGFTASTLFRKSPNGSQNYTISLINYRFGTPPGPPFFLKNCRETIWLANGRAIRKPVSNYIGLGPDATGDIIGSNKTTEAIYTEFSPSEMTQLAESPSIEYRVCVEDGSFTYEELNGLRSVLRLSQQ